MIVSNSVVWMRARIATSSSRRIMRGKRIVTRPNGIPDAARTWRCRPSREAKTQFAEEQDGQTLAAAQVNGVLDLRDGLQDLRSDARSAFRFARRRAATNIAGCPVALASVVTGK